MKSITTFLCVLLLTAGISRAELLLKPNDTLAICGDSITEQRIYSVYMESYLLMCQPVEGLRVVQFGWGGERVPGFVNRIASDVQPFKPTVATTCYGMNDGTYRAMTPGIGDTYRQAMTEAVVKLKGIGVRSIVVGSPGCVDGAAFNNPQTTADIYNQTLAGLTTIAQEVATKTGVQFADVHDPMMDVMAKAKAAYGDTYQLVAGGGIHPGPNGQLVMAYAFLKGLGCDGAIGTITVDLGANQATGTPGQKVVSFEKGTVTLKSTRYPFCFGGDPAKGDQNNASVLRFFPFNDDLNRYVLIVKGIKGTKAKITWGTQSKEFPAADLEKGVNLAAEFIVNPFCQQFNKVSAAVLDQQTMEVTLTKTFLHNKVPMVAMAPENKEAFDQITAVAMKRDKALFTAAQNMVVPISHTIHIESEP